MSADLRLLLRALADEAPPLPDRLALADRSYAAGRRRRRIRHLELTGGTAIVLVLTVFAALFAGSSPLAAQYGTSSATHVSGYPRHIGRQLPVLDLPAKPGPIAGLLSNGDEWWAVSPNGHRWTLPNAGGVDGPSPTVSADGRLVGYVDSTSGVLGIHNLTTGTVVVVPQIGSLEYGNRATLQAPDETHGLFSADDRYLGLSGNGDFQLIVDVQTGRVTRTPREDTQFVAGWTGDSLVTASGTDATVRSAVDGSTREVQLRLSAPLADSYQSSSGVSTGGVLILLSGGRTALQKIIQVDLATGAQIGSQRAAPSAMSICGFTAGREVYYTHTDAATGGVSVVSVDSAGVASTPTTIDPALNAYCGIWASDAFDGGAKGRLAVDRLSSWLMSDWPWIAWSVGILCGVLFITWRVRRFSRQYALDFPDRVAARRPWPRRKKALLLGVPLASVLTALGLLVPYVYLPVHSGDLKPVQPAIWWTALDQSAARPSSWQGDPASQIPFRSGEQQGFLVLVANPTGRPQKVLPADPDEYSLAVSTTRGSVTQARSLVFHASGTIPARQSRWVRMLLRTDICWEKGGGTAMSALTLQIRIGWLTRSEVIPLVPQMKFIATTNIKPPGGNC